MAQMEEGPPLSGRGPQQQAPEKGWAGWLLPLVDNLLPSLTFLPASAVLLTGLGAKEFLPDSQASRGADCRAVTQRQATPFTPNTNPKG